MNDSDPKPPKGLDPFSQSIPLDLVRPMPETPALPSPNNPAFAGPPILKAGRLRVWAEFVIWPDEDDTVLGFNVSGKTVERIRVPNALLPGVIAKLQLVLDELHKTS